MTKNVVADVFEEALRLAREKALRATSEDQRKVIMAEFQAALKERGAVETMLVKDAEGVVIRDLRLSSPGRHIEGRSMSVPIVKFSNAKAMVTDCAVVGSPGSGVYVLDGSDVEIRGCLVAGVWSTGIAVHVVEGGVAKARIVDCDVRNCHHRGITIGRGCDSTVVERCRISGSAWHGIRYDHCSPTIVGNVIFDNARFGIYASGETAATIRQNLFYGNQMAGISCWFRNQDTIEGNTFAENTRAGLEILGASKPIVRKNIFFAHPSAVYCGDIGSDSADARSDGTVKLEENLFWDFEHKVAWRRPADTEGESVTEDVALADEAGNVAYNPEFENLVEGDFSLRAGSRARRSGIGVAEPLKPESPWPLQSEEVDIVEKLHKASDEQVSSSEGPKTNASASEETTTKHPGRITGVVVNSATGGAIAGAYVGVGDFGDSGGSNYSRHREQGFHDKTKTDAKGRFELDGLVFTDENQELDYHPLVVTHPDFVRHDEKIELLKKKLEPEVKVNLRPASKIEVTIVDADGNPLEGQWLLRLEALDGRRFIPPGSDPHLSSFASNIWEQMPDLRRKMGVSNGFTFTELDTGEYSIEALRFHLVDNPTPQNIWEPTITYHGAIPRIEIKAGQAKQVKLAPQDNQTRLTIIPPAYPDKLMGKLERSSQMPPLCLVSRSPGAMLWYDGKIRHLEDQRLGRIDKTRFFRGFFTKGQPLTINNLPPDSYSLFAMGVYGQVAGYLIGARTNLAKGDNVTVDMPWRQPTGPSMFGPNRSFDYPVKLEARDYSVSQLCGILTEITRSNPRIIAEPSIANEKLSFGKSQMSIWDLLEKLYLDKGWTVKEGKDKTLIIEPVEQIELSVQEPLKKGHVVHFPADRSLGMLCVQRETIGAPIHWWWGLHDQWQFLRSPWQYLAEARGDVAVPAGKRLGLIVDRDGLKDLAHLAKLRPDDLYMLSIKCGENAADKPGDDCMSYLGRLTGLKELILEYPGITNEGLRSIGGLSSLERLSLISQQLEDTGMSHIAELESLKGLRYHSMSVTNAGLLHLSKLTLLEELFPSGIIDDEGLAHLTKLPALRYLFLASGDFTENGLTHLKRIPSLRKLEVGSIEYGSEGLAHISRIPGLEELSISHTVLSDEDLVPFKSMASLKRLSLSPAIQQMARDFTDGALFHLSGIKSLESLELGYGKFTDKGLEYLKEMDNLKRLDIPNNSGFTDAGLSHVAKLPLLEELKLRANQFTDAGMSSIGKLTTLKRLELWGHRAGITNKGLAHLAELNKLSYLVIKGNFNDEGLAHVGNLKKLSYLDISGGFTDEGLHHLEGLNLLKQLKISYGSELSPRALKDLRNKLSGLLVLS
jgi:parallel beta-helix repeat protein